MISPSFVINKTASRCNFLPALGMCLHLAASRQQHQCNTDSLGLAQSQAFARSARSNDAAGFFIP